MSEKISYQEQPKAGRIERLLGAMGLAPTSRDRLEVGNLDETETLSGIPIETIGDGLMEDLDRAAAEHDEPRIYFNRG